MAAPTIAADFTKEPTAFFTATYDVQWSGPYQTATYLDNDNHNVQLIWQSQKVTLGENDLFYLSIRAQVAAKANGTGTQTFFVANLKDFDVSDNDDNYVTVVCQYDSTQGSPADQQTTFINGSTETPVTSPPNADMRNDAAYGPIDYTNLGLVYTPFAPIIMAGLGTFTAANDDGWFLTTCDAMVATGAWVSKADGDLLGDLKPYVSKPKFLVGWGGYDDIASISADNNISYPENPYEIDLILYDPADDSAFSTVASIVTAATVALAMF